MVDLLAEEFPGIKCWVSYTCKVSEDKYFILSVLVTCISPIILDMLEKS